VLASSNEIEKQGLLYGDNPNAVVKEGVLASYAKIMVKPFADKYYCSISISAGSY